MDCGLCGRAVCDCYLESSSGDVVLECFDVVLECFVPKTQLFQTQGADSRAASDYYLPFTGLDKRPLQYSNL